ncbi:ABC transporter permease [Actinocorallia sp. A-T 12471]|uniref:ABC transporter permease n=1 Tax=Actinocorallia sp. A-T 12471 TaxID=3089813 RepID=UPI0029CC3262|nr:ABC transporter permease [Actinocorallia sp. A-T 12471]MDX6744254.1 ABC transporter permease [Actinocorallia sp. A-T 12471]
MSAVTVAAEGPSGVRRVAVDTWTMTWRQLLHWRNRPGLKVFGWLFPVLMMGMFSALLGGALSAGTGGDYLAFVMPGVLTMTVFFGLEGTMGGVAADASKGVTDRLRSLPVGGFAVVGGRAAADLLDSLVSLAVVVAAGLAFGWRPDTSAGSLAIALGLLLLLRLAMLFLGIHLGLKAKTPETVQAVQIAVWPVLFLSSVFVDTSTMPGWLAVVADANPLSATSTALRDLLGAPTQAASWLAGHAMPAAVLGPVLLLALLVPLSIRTWRDAAR